MISTVMTHEQFITLETARLARKAGFDWKVCAYYGDNVFFTSSYYDNFNKRALADYTTFSAPTQSVLQRWLREVKNIWVSVTCDCAGDLQYSMYRAELYNEEIGYYYTSYWDDDEKKEYAEEYPTYEAALEAGLQKCLTLIIEKQ